MDANDMVRVGSVAMGDASRLKNALETRGITVEIAVNPASCASGGCSPKSEIWAMADDMPAIQDFFAQQHAKSLEGFSFDPAVLHSVFDPDQAEATCPACATRFATTLGECPDCGLSFHVALGGGDCSPK